MIQAPLTPLQRRQTELLAFDSPAGCWEEALPLENGRLGAMVFGVPGRERIQLNEDSIWSGKYRNRNNSAARIALPEIPRLLDEGRVREAEDYCIESFSGIPSAQRVYQTAGDLYIDFSPSGEFGHAGSGTRSGPLFHDLCPYRRELDISAAVHRLAFVYQGIEFRWECFISAPADVRQDVLGVGLPHSSMTVRRYTKGAIAGLLKHTTNKPGT